MEVLSYEPHPFFVLTLFQPQIGAIEWGRVHPILHAFVDLARRTAPVRAVALAAQQGGVVGTGGDHQRSLQRRAHLASGSNLLNSGAITVG